MKEFFKMMGASMLGFFLVCVIFFFLIFGLVAILVTVATTEEVSISPNTILHLELDKPILDRSPKSPIVFDLASMSRKTGLNTILENIKKAGTDKNIAGIYLDITSIPAGISTISEIRSALMDFKTSGKFIYCYSEDYSQSAYYLATAADKIYLHPEGSMLFKGINAELFFLKGTLEKLDIKVQVIRHGKFKAATEPFFLDKMSPENREQMNALIGSVWNHLLREISDSRKISIERLNQMADSLAVQSAGDALKYKLVDKLVYKDEVLQELKQLTNTDKTVQPMLSTAALAALQHYHFPGNVRELENVLERALALYDGKCIEIDDLNLPVSLQNDSDAQKYDPATSSLEDYLEAIERKAITLALEENKWNKTAAAKQLGLSFRSFRYRLKKLGLDN